MDSKDLNRMNEARNELQGMLELVDTVNVPVVVLANKQDIPSKLRLLFPSRLFTFIQEDRDIHMHLFLVIQYPQRKGAEQFQVHNYGHRNGEI